MHYGVQGTALNRDLFYPPAFSCCNSKLEGKVLVVFRHLYPPAESENFIFPMRNIRI